MTSLVNLAIFLLIGLLAGFVASKIIKGKSLGILWNMIIGVIGSFLGSFIWGLLGFGAGNILGQIALAIGGAIILLFLIGILKKKL